MAKTNDITGQKFGRLTVIKPTDQRAGSFVIYECACDCGSIKLINGNNLRRGLTRSCGCLRREASATRQTTHGQGGTTTYKTWAHMLDRCRNPNSKKWSRYGGRGIQVCERWLLFENFVADMGAKPTGTTLDRIDNNGNYEPHNCRWATQKTQQNNRSTNHVLVAFGKAMNISQWATFLGKNRDTIRRRLDKGWALEKVLSSEKYTRRSSGR